MGLSNLTNVFGKNESIRKTVQKFINKNQDIKYARQLTGAKSVKYRLWMGCMSFEI
jgi:hypothetical protein